MEKIEKPQAAVASKRRQSVTSSPHWWPISSCKKRLATEKEIGIDAASKTLLEVKTTMTLCSAVMRLLLLISLLRGGSAMVTAAVGHAHDVGPALERLLEVADVAGDVFVSRYCEGDEGLQMMSAGCT